MNMNVCICIYTHILSCTRMYVCGIYTHIVSSTRIDMCMHPHACLPMSIHVDIYKFMCCIILDNT